LNFIKPLKTILDTKIEWVGYYLIWVYINYYLMKLYNDTHVSNEKRFYDLRISENLFVERFV